MGLSSCSDEGGLGTGPWGAANEASAPCAGGCAVAGGAARFAAGDEGKWLQNQARLQTDALDPPHLGVPWVSHLVSMCAAATCCGESAG